MAGKALDGLQSSALQLLVQPLIKEAKFVQGVHAPSEREVSQFMKTGQAAENQRVGQLLNEVLEQVLHMDWKRQQVRRMSAPLPPLGVALGTVPLVERLRVKSLESGDQAALLLHTQHTDLGQMEGEFWQAFEDLDRDALVESTLATLALWLAMARKAGIELDAAEEQIESSDGSTLLRFSVPHVALNSALLANIDWEL